MGAPMRFFFDEAKAAQATAYLLTKHGGKMKYMALIKLLYLADRRALVEIGRSITGDEMVSMPHGPVLSMVYELINLGPQDEARPSPWFKYVKRDGRYHVSLAEEAPSLDDLSPYETRVMDEIDERYGRMQLWDLVEFTHALEEWVDPEGSSRRIDPETILRSENKSQEEIERIGKIAREIRFIQSVRPR